MSQRSNHVPPDPSTDSPRSRTGKRLLLRCALWGALGIGLAVVAFGAYAVTYPEKMPASVGLMVENLTGENPDPVHLRLPKVAPLSAVAQLGKQIFYDTSLSASGTQSCSSCHSPQHSYGPTPAEFPVAIGGPHMNLPGYRPPPSLTYLYRQANFSIGPDPADTEISVSVVQQAASAVGVQKATKDALVAPTAPAIVPQGGLFWDGRADSLQLQAYGPMLNPVEMANTSLDEVAHKLLVAKYHDQFKQLFGPSVLVSPGLLVSEAMFAVGRYQIEDPSFHLFTSKYDYWLQGKARLTSAELRGLRLFNDPNKANCAGCHLSQPSKDGLPPLFTDTQYEGLGAPRNPLIPANKNPHYYDMGICGPWRTDLTAQTQYCGMFLTPTLRNAANRGIYFHNGVYHTLQEVMNFYDFRNTNPEKIYPVDANGKVEKYNDIPAKYDANMDVVDPPFDRKLGDKPAMSEQDMKDIIAFMQTLDDGYQPHN